MSRMPSSLRLLSRLATSSRTHSLLTPDSPLFLYSSRFVPQSRLFSKRTRKKYVEPVSVKETATRKRVVEFYKDMTAQELSESLNEPFDDVVDILVNLDKRNLELVSLDAPLDQEWSAKAISAFNCKPKLTIRPKKKEEVMDDLLPQAEAAARECRPRAPVVTIMGHVDHGKTTLLDSLRNSRIVDGEFGGITQHIGAFSVLLPSSEKRVTFLDTPGHAAFAAMRERGARVTDIVVLVVAADDGVKEQTVQSIESARAKRSLLEHEIVVEELGGDVQCVEISALYGTNISTLQESILTLAELLNLRATSSGLVEGHVVESSLAHGLGKVCTVLISRGTLKRGRILVAGTAYTRVRTITDDVGRDVSEAGPSSPVRVSGWKENLPAPGDRVLEARDTAVAHRAIAYRIKREMDEKAERDWSETQGKREAEREAYLKRRQRMLDSGWRYGSTLRRIAHREQRLQKAVASGHPTLRILLRCDVEGTLEAILDVLATYSSAKADLQLVDFGVGPPTEKDVDMAQNAEAIIYTFNVQPSPNARLEAEKAGVSFRPFNVVYRLVESLKGELSATLPTITELHLIGQGHVLKEFLISDRARKKQPIAGVIVDWGDFQKKAIYRFSRNQEVYYEGEIESMKCALEVVSSAKTNTEVGLAIADKSIRFKEDDSIEVFEQREVKQEIDWFPPGF